MFFIDYTLPWYSRLLACLDAPFRYAWRHLISYFQSKAISRHTGCQILTQKERIGHFVVAFLEVLPIFGLFVAVVDWLICRKPSKSASFAYMINRVLPVYKRMAAFRKCDIKGLDEYIPERYTLEMKALAKESGIAYEDIFALNTLPDTLNLFETHLWAESKGSVKSAKKKIRSQNHRDTVLTAIFEGKKRTILLTKGSDYAANRYFKQFTLCKAGAVDALLAICINWPMALFAPLGELVLRESEGKYHATAVISYPGLIGGYAGMNDTGLILSASIGRSDARGGIPRQFLIRQILEEASSIQEALKILDQCQVSSLMHLLIAGSDGSVEATLDPARKRRGIVHLSYDKK